MMKFIHELNPQNINISLKIPVLIEKHKYVYTPLLDCEFFLTGKIFYKDPGECIAFVISAITKKDSGGERFL